MRLFHTLMAVGIGSGLCALAADDPSMVRGPVAGYVFDRASASIRPVNGLPGSSTLGDPLSVPVRLKTAAVHATADYAAGIAEETGALVLVRSLAGTPDTVTELVGLTNLKSLVLDPAGKRLAAYSPEDGRIYIVGGLPDAPEISAAVESRPQGTVDQIALHRDTLAFTVQVESSIQLVLVRNATNTNREVQDVATLASAAGLVFSPAGERLYVSEPSAGRVLALSTDTLEPETLLSERDGLSHPAALCADTDRLLIANTGHQTAIIVDLPARSFAGILPLASEPTRCDRLDNRGLFVMNEAGASPLVVVDLNSVKSYFVPAGQQ